MSSPEGTGSTVKQLVEELKQKGWSFTYMGANQDAVEVAFTLSIRNARNFAYSDAGATMAMAKDCSTRMNLFKKVHHFHETNMDGAMSEADMAQSYTEMANEAFDEVGE